MTSMPSGRLPQRNFPDDSLEPCGRGRRPGGAGGPGATRCALRRLLVSPLCVRPSPRLRPGAAQDLTQDFFAHVLEKGLLARADPGRGRFRSFLLAVFAHYLSNRRDHERALKRGGGRATFSIDIAGAEGRYDRELVLELTPERAFDRSWALTLLGRVLDQLRREYDDAGRGATFEALCGNLIEDAQGVAHATVAAGLGMSEGAARVAAHRLRRRYGLLLSARSPPRSTTRTRSTTRSGPLRRASGLSHGISRGRGNDSPRVA